MGADDIEAYECEQEIALFREFRELAPQYRYSVETDRRMYLANFVDVRMHTSSGETFFEVEMEDAWVWDVYRPTRFVNKVRVYSFRDVNIEETFPAEMPSH